MENKYFFCVVSKAIRFSWKFKLIVKKREGENNNMYHWLWFTFGKCFYK